MNRNNQAQNVSDTIVPMFMPANMEQPVATKAKTPVNETELSLFDVKELYDRAYAEKNGGGDEAAFKKTLAEAVKLDLAYRRQLAKAAPYKDRTKLRNFKTATKNAQVA